MGMVNRIIILPINIDNSMIRNPNGSVVSNKRFTFVTHKYIFLLIEPSLVLTIVNQSEY